MLAAQKKQFYKLSRKSDEQLNLLIQLCASYVTRNETVPGWVGEAIGRIKLRVDRMDWLKYAVEHSGSRQNFDLVKRVLREIVDDENEIAELLDSAGAELE